MFPELCLHKRRKGKTAAAERAVFNMGKVDPKLLEMADVFHIPAKARMKYIILPAKMPGLSKLLNGKNAGKTDRDGNDRKEGGSR